ncbi:MAG: RnfABCDGE type electron transport complex subunit D [Bacilli bacterium]|nr:RnfABCDGE type electron transport complex subunit D [Bacilli bacterium]
MKELKGTYIKDDNSTYKMMNNLLLALIPIILFSFYKNGYIPYAQNKTNITGLFYPLMFIIIPAFTSYLTELLWHLFVLKKRGRELLISVKSSFSIFPGLFLGLILSMNTPISVLILGSIFATIVGKMIFGGFGRNILNPALVGMLFVVILSALNLTNSGGYLNPSEIDSLAGATPLSNVVNGIGSYTALVKPYGNLWDFFLGSIPGSMGETSALLCILGFIFLTVKKVIKPIIPVLYISTVFISTFAIGFINGLGIWYPLFQVLSGGLMFGAVFMATDPVTSPVTRVGQIIYGVSLGILTVIIRYLTPFPEGILVSILIMNMLVFILDRIGFKSRFKRIYTVIPIVSLIGLLSITTLYIGNSFDNDLEKLTVLSKETSNEITTYVVEVSGYSSVIKAEIKLNSTEVVSYTILEDDDNFYPRVKQTDFVNDLVENQANLNDVDTVAGATISSQAIKNLLINVINDYTNGEGYNYSKVTDEETDFVIESTEETAYGTIYNVKKNSYGGDLRLAVLVSDGIIVNIDVIEQNDSRFDEIYNNDYLNQIIDNQYDLVALDTIGGATESSSNLKQAVIDLLSSIGDNDE